MSAKMILKTLVYNLLKNFVVFCLRIFFNVEVVGKENIPDIKEPIIFAGTHRNMMFDPLIIMGFSPSKKKISAAAKSTLWNNKLLGAFLSFLDVQPVNRAPPPKGMTNAEEAVLRSKTPSTDSDTEKAPIVKVDNSKLFTSLNNWLAGGNSILIFPEGVSHSEPYLLPLKTGMARIAFNLLETHPEIPFVNIAPVGITYFHKEKFRSRMVVYYGKNISLTQDDLVAYKEDSRKAVKDFTNAIKIELENLCDVAPDWETYGVLDLAQRLYLPEGTKLKASVYTELRRRFVKGYLENKDNPALQKLFEQIKNYKFNLEMLELLDSQLSIHSKNQISVGFRLIKNIIYLITIFPLSFPFLLLNAPMYLMGSRVDKKTKNWDVKASKKLVFGLLLAPTIYITISILVFVLWLNPNNIPYKWYYFFASLIILPVLSFSSTYIIHYQMNIFKSLRSISKQMKFSNFVKELRKERLVLQGQIRKAVGMFADPTKERIISPEEIEKAFLIRQETGNAGEFEKYFTNK